MAGYENGQKFILVSSSSENQMKGLFEGSESMAVASAPQGNHTNGVIDVNFIELMYRILASWKLIVCLALIGAILAGMYTTFFMTPIYESDANIYVLGRKDSAINISDLNLGSALTKDYIKVFDMWEIHEEVIQSLQLPYSEEKLRSMLSIGNDSNTRILRITVASTNAAEAAAIANQYAAVVCKYIEETMATDKPNIMSVARPAKKPVSPKTSTNIALGFIGGFALAIAICFFRFVADDKIKTAEDARKYTGWPVLAVVPVDDLKQVQDIKPPKASGRQKGSKKNAKRDD